MTGSFQPPSDSREIDSRPCQTLAGAHRAGPAAPGPARVPREDGGTSREPVPRALELADDDRPRSVIGEQGARAEELRALPAGEYQVVENRLRRMADRQSLQLVKSRRRDPHSPNHGRYMLIDRLSTAVPAGGDWSLDLGEVEQILLGTDPAARRSNARDCPRCDAPTYSLSGLVAGALVDDRECPDCGHSFIADPGPDELQATRSL